MRTVSMLIKSAALALLLHAAQASAAFFVGDTTGSPTFNRPFTTTQLSSVGTDVAYDTFAFTVSADGNYTFRSFAQGAFRNAPTWDNFLVLYAGSFDPSQGLANILTLNDDLNGNIGSGRAGFDWSLTAGDRYVLVTTGFANSDDGVYLDLIRGPGAVTQVPEPQTAAMLLIGLAACGLLARRHGRDLPSRRGRAQLPSAGGATRSQALRWL